MNAQTRVFEPAFVFSANWQMAVKEGMVKVGNAVCMIAVVAAALFHLTRKLRKGNDRYVEVLGQRLQ